MQWQSRGLRILFVVLLVVLAGGVAWVMWDVFGSKGNEDVAAEGVDRALN